MKTTARKRKRRNAATQRSRILYAILSIRFTGMSFGPFFRPITFHAALVTAFRRRTEPDNRPRPRPRRLRDPNVRREVLQRRTAHYTNASLPFPVPPQQPNDFPNELPPRLSRPLLVLFLFFRIVIGLSTIHDGSFRRRPPADTSAWGFNLFDGSSSLPWVEYNPRRTSPPDGEFADGALTCISRKEQGEHKHARALITRKNLMAFDSNSNSKSPRGQQWHHVSRSSRRQSALLHRPRKSKSKMHVGG